MRRVERLPTRDCDAGYGPGLELATSPIALGPLWIPLTTNGMTLDKNNFPHTRNL